MLGALTPVREGTAGTPFQWQGAREGSRDLNNIGESLPLARRGLHGLVTEERPWQGPGRAMLHQKRLLRQDLERTAF